MVANNPIIKVMVSCHKPVRWPTSDLYLPVHVGAHQSPLGMSDAQRDDEGDNISQRNFTFCEMTAQYWGWKHLDADYVGLCHYRRYFCFDGIEHVKNDHAQIEIDCLSQKRIDEYRLADEALIRSEVVKYDVVIPERWIVDDVPTPMGPQPTVRKHMVAYGLMSDESIDQLLKICKRLRSEYEPYVRAYLNGNVYQGYNCFIMKSSLFEQLCEFEFEVLQAFDESFDYSNLTATEKRIIGYFGEILISAFTLKIEREGLAKIAQYPLTFFEDTPNPSGLAGHRKSGLDAELVWFYPEGSPENLAVGLGSLPNIGGLGRNIGVTLVVPPKFDQSRALMLSPLDGVDRTISWATWPVVEGLEILPTSFSERDCRTVLPFLLPWLLPGRDRGLFARGLILCLDACSDFSSYVAGAAVNVHLQRELNKPHMSSLRKAVGKQGRLGTLLGCHFLVLDLAFLRKQLGPEDVVALYRQTKDKVANWLNEAAIVEMDELAASVIQALMLNDLGFVEIPVSSVSQALYSEDTRRWANDCTVSQWFDAVCPSIAVFGEDGIPNASFDMRFEVEYWRQARKTPAYEKLLAQRNCVGLPETVSIWGRLFPEGTVRGGVVRALASVMHLR